MTIRAKYRGNCVKCGGEITPGDVIEWERGRGSYHAVCPEKPQPAEGQIRISQGQGYGGREFQIGETLRHPNHGVVTVLKAGKRYYRQDGMSFGVGDDEGYLFWAEVRPATEEEAAPILAAEAEAEKQNRALSRLDEIRREIKNGEYPTDEQPEGERVLDTQDIYGGGDWFVIGPAGIWYIRNNGRDGDDWSHNNVGTGGAGAIGWRIPFDQALADELFEIERILQPNASRRTAQRKEREEKPKASSEAYPEWIGEDRPARIVNKDPRFGPAVFCNTSHPRGYNPQFVAGLSIEPDVRLVHAFEHRDVPWQLWDDGICTVRFILHSPLDQKLVPPAIYEDDISLLIGVGLTMPDINEKPGYKEWLLSMHHVGGEKVLKNILKREIARFEDGHEEAVLIDTMAEVPVDDEPAIKVIYENGSRNTSAQVLQIRVTFQDGHQEYVYLSQHDWWYMGADGDAGTVWYLRTAEHRKEAIESARKWIKP